MPTSRRHVPARAVLTSRNRRADAGAAPPDTAVAYVRVSQAREAMISPEIQRDAITAWSGQTDIPVEDTIEDLDLSGRSFAKRSILGIIERVERGEVRTVVVYNWSRFGRNTMEALINIARIETSGGRVVSATEPIDAASPTGRFGRTTLLAVAELQSDTIGEGWRATMNNRVRRGLPGTGRDRYGYVAHRATVPGGRMCMQGCAAGECQTGFVVDPDTGPVLAGMYEDYISGKGFGRIANALNARGVPSPSGRSVWRVDSVGRVLDSGFGAGLVYAHGQHHPGVHEPVISEATWAAFREARDLRATVPARSFEPLWDLAGLARCGRCGGRMTVASTRQGARFLLRCATESLAGKSMCAGTWIKRSTAEETVRAWLDEWADPIERATAAAVAAGPLPGVPDAARDRRRLERKIAEGESGIERLADAVARGMPLADYLAARGRAQADLDTARDELAALNAATPPVPGRPAVRRLRRQWEELSVRARRDVLSSLLLAVVVHPKDHPEPRVEVVPRPDLPPRL